MKDPARLAAGALVLSAIASLALAAVYIAGGEPQLEGPLLGVSLGGIGAALILWGKRILPDTEEQEQRDLPSSDEDVDAAQEAVEEGGEELARRRFLVRLLAAAGGALGVALVFPIRSLGPSPGRSLLETDWRAGVGVVTEDGQPVRLDALEQGSIATVFPEDAIGSSDAQAVLVRVAPDRLRLPPGREAWAPSGNVCYSKVCTHAGCPVGLYVETESALRCPCHQSQFNVLNGAEPIGGPAVRPLAQLPLQVDADGYLIAGGGFSGPVGPSFWNLP